MDFHKLREANAKKLAKEDDDPCWDSHKQVGMKKKNGKDVPNCVPKEDVQVDEDVEQVDEAAPKIKKATMKGDTASGVSSSKKLSTYSITMQTSGRKVMFRVKDELSGDIKTVDAKALAKLL